MLRSFGLVLMMLLIGLILAACAAAAPPPPYIRLNNVTLLPHYSSTPAIVPLRVAVAAVISPKGNVESYSPLLDYLSARLNRPAEMVQRRTYAEVNDLIRDGKVDVAFVCTSAYVAGQREFGMQLVAAPQVAGEALYYSYLIAPIDSPARSMADFKGKVFAFTDPMSNSGHNYPLWLVRRLGYEPEAFFARTFFTYSHDDAIRAVADNLAAGAAVDSLVYDFALARDATLAGKVKVIQKSMPFGAPPVVVGPEARPQLRAELYELLTTLEQSTEGRAILQSLGVDRFIPIDDSAYDSVRRIEREIGPP